ncbi:MAG: chromosome segregation ATPase [Myxococcaceae bacterium]|nr:chromosome segregation ATPase [Myxococcaceae bacterium]
MRVVAVVNQKGGAGKTAAAVHVAASLVKMGLRVLLIDMDAQGNAGTCLGLQKDGSALLDVLRGQRTLVSAVEPSPHGVDVVCGGPALEGLDVVLFMAKKGLATFTLKQALHEAPPNWDFILIDCPPNLGTATASALVAATEVLIPVQAGGEALEGVGRLNANIEEVKAVNPKLRVVGVLPCMTKKGEVLTTLVESTLQETFGELVFPVSIGRNTKIGQAYVMRQPMHAFDKKSPSVKQYDAVARELVARGEGHL